MKRLFGLFLTCTISFAAPVYSRTDNATLFGARESIENISLSPDGSKVAFLQPAVGQRSVLYIAKLDGSAPIPIQHSDGDPWKLTWCAWASSSRLVCNLYGLIDSGTGYLPFTRLVAFDSDGRNAKQLGEQVYTSLAMAIRQFDGEIIGWLPDDNGEVLMSRAYVPETEIGTRLAKKAAGLGVDIVNSKNLKISQLEKPRVEAVAYLADSNGHVRLMQTAQANFNGDLSGVFQFYYRTPDSKDWKPFSKIVSNTDGLRPAAVDSARNIAYTFKKKDGRDALYSVSLDGKMTEQLILENDKVDVDRLIRFGRSGRVIGAQVISDKRETILFDEEHKALAKKLGKALPNLPLVTMVDASRNEQKILIFAGSDIDPGRYYVYDKASKQLAEIALSRPELEGKPIAPVKMIQYPAADGTSIPAYLTSPLGDAKPRAAIVMPHGGPSSRDEWGFDWMAQYYAAQGYAVLQPNFRGSSGYGDDWYEENGFKSWRTAIGDVNDAGRWLVEQNIAAADKLAVVGWSYGGYAALQSPALDPDLFKAIVAVAPVTDLKMLIKDKGRFTSAKLVAEFVGSGEHLVSGSPLQQVEKIKAPVLLFSGNRDLNVDISHSEAMESMLRKNGKSVEFVKYDKLDHQLEDSAARSDMLRRSDEFLRKNLKL